RLYPTRRARRAAAGRGTLRVASDHLAATARTRIDTEETGTQAGARRPEVETTRAGQSAAHHAAAESGSRDRFPKKSCRAPADPAETHAERRDRLMTAVERVATSIGTAPACRALGLPRASVYRGRRPAAVTRPRPTPPRALDRVERQEVLDLLHTRFVDQAPAQVHAAL